MSELREKLEEYIKYRIQDRKFNALCNGYNEGCHESKEITDELQELLDGDYSCLRKLGESQ